MKGEKRMRQSDTLFSKEIADGVFRIASTTFGCCEKPGKPCRNSYLIVGSRKALLYDLALEEKELKEYAESLCRKEMVTVIGHAHIDHIYNIEQFEKILLHPADEFLLTGGAVFQPPVKNLPEIQFIEGGDTIDLGDRVLDVIHIPGHTPGSILLFDRKTQILISGDTVARRLLLGLHGEVHLDRFCESLMKLQKYPIKAIFSAHDNCALPAGYIRFMVQNLTGRAEKEAEIKPFPFYGKALMFSVGTEDSRHYFDFAMPVIAEREENAED